MIWIYTVYKDKACLGSAVPGLKEGAIFPHKSSFYEKIGDHIHYMFGSIVYNQVIVYKRQNFLKVVVHMIFIDQCNKTAC